MKYFLTLFFLCFALSGHSQEDSAENSISYPLKVTLQNLDSAKVYNHGKSCFRNLRIKLTNTADTAFSFWIMSCNWHPFVRITPRIAWPNFHSCDRNTPEEIILKPNEYHILDFEYAFLKSKVLHPVQIRAGFRVVSDDLYQKIVASGRWDARFEILHDNPKYTDKDFIWSNSVKIAF